MSFQIRLDDEYVITGNGRQYLLTKIRIADVSEKTGESVECLAPVGFYQNIELLIHELIRRKITHAETCTLEEILKEIKSLANKYSIHLEGRK